MLEVTRARNQKCSGCGQVTAEWLTPEGRVVDVGEEPAVLETHWCPACDELQEKQEELRESGSTRGKSLRFRAPSPYDGIEDDDE